MLRRGIISYQSKTCDDSWMPFLKWKMRWVSMDEDAGTASIVSVIDGSHEVRVYYFSIKLTWGLGSKVVIRRLWG